MKIKDLHQFKGGAKKKFQKSFKILLKGKITQLSQL